MANWFYYDAQGVKQGPVPDAHLRRLVEIGTVKVETIVETTDGRQTPAGNLRGLFDRTEPATKKMESPLPAPPAADTLGTLPPAMPTAPLPAPPLSMETTNEPPVTTSHQTLSPDSQAPYDDDDDDDDDESYSWMQKYFSILMVFSWMCWGVALVCLIVTFGVAKEWYRRWEIPYWETFLAGFSTVAFLMFLAEIGRTVAVIEIRSRR